MELHQALKDAGRELKEAQKRYEIIEAAILAEQRVKELDAQKVKLEAAVQTLNKELSGLQGQTDKVQAALEEAQTAAKQEMAADKAAATGELQALRKQTEDKQKELAGVASKLESALEDMNIQIKIKMEEADREEVRLRVAQEALAELKGKL